MKTRSPARMNPKIGPGAGRWLLESLLVATGLTLAVSLRLFEPIWEVEPGLRAIGLLTGLAYLVGSAAHRRSAGAGVGRAALITIVVSQPLLLALWLLDLGGSRVVLVGELGLLFVAVAAAGLRWPAPTVRVALAFVFAAVASLPTLAGIVGRDAALTASNVLERRYAFTSYVDLSVTTHRVATED